jgi:pimeloyl-ACP methyl ester carboxylesterase
MTTWVLLRGLMRESRHWGDFKQQFSQAMQTQAVITPDFPGNGSLYAQKSLSSVAEMVNHLRSQLKQAGYAPPYNILALSLGAMVAVSWHEQYPDELEKIVLINTSLASYSPFYYRLLPKNYLAIPLLLLGSSSQRERLILKLSSERSRIENLHRIREQWISYAQEYPVTPGNILRQLNAAAKYHPAKAAPHNNVLLLAGQKDQLVNVRCSLTLAKEWGCAIRLHPHAGHDLPLDDGPWVIQQIQEWLKL